MYITAKQLSYVFNAINATVKEQITETECKEFIAGIVKECIQENREKENKHGNSKNI